MTIIVMERNIANTKTMIVSKKTNSTEVNIALDEQQIEQVSSYVYIGSLGREIRKGKQGKENDRTDVIHQHEKTYVVPCRGSNLKTRLRAIK